MEAVYILGFLIISTSGAVKLSSSEVRGYHEMISPEIPETDSQFTYVVLRRHPATTQQYETKDNQLYDLETVPNQQTHSRKAIDNNKQRVPYSIPRRKIYNRRAHFPHQEQFLKEVAPTTITMYEEQSDEESSIHYTKTADLSLRKEQTDAEQQDQEKSIEPRVSYVDVTSLESVQPRLHTVVYFPQDYNNFLPPRNSHNHIAFLPPRTNTYQKLLVENALNVGNPPLKKNSPSPVFEEVVEETEKITTQKSRPPQAHLRQSNSFTQTPRLQSHILNEEFYKIHVPPSLRQLQYALNVGNPPLKQNSLPQVFEEVAEETEEITTQKPRPPQARLRQSHNLQSHILNEEFYKIPVPPSLRQLQYAIKRPEIPYRFNSLEPSAHTQQVPFPYYKQFQTREESVEHGIDAEIVKRTQASIPTPRRLELGRRKQQSATVTSQADNQEMLGTKLSYHHNLEIPETSYPRWKYRVLPVTNLPFTKQRAIQIVQDEDE